MPVYPKPAQDLYIYYVHGCLHTPAGLSGPAFLGNWEEGGFSFLFFSKPARHTIDQLLKQQPHLKLEDEFHMSYDQWQGGPLTPMHIGRFTIIPPWCDDPAPSGRHAILIDPGVVFGNGTHPTTRACLDAVEMVYGRHKAETVLDLGTGTGMLALAAARLGGRKILAVDLNRLAAVTAHRNVRLNDCEDRIVVALADARQCLTYPSDLLIANIHFDVMARIIASPDFTNHKYFILSGLLRSQLSDVDLMLGKQSCNIIKHWENDGVWHTLLGGQASSFTDEQALHRQGSQSTP